MHTALADYIILSSCTRTESNTDVRSQPLIPHPHTLLQVLAASVSQKHVVWGEDWIMKCRRSGKWLPVGLHGFKHTTNLFDKQTVVVLPSFRASAPMPRMKILGTLIQRFGLGKMVDLSSGGARKRSKAVSANFVLVGDGLGHPGEILKDYKISVDKVSLCCTCVFSKHRYCLSDHHLTCSRRGTRDFLLIYFLCLRIHIYYASTCAYTYTDTKIHTHRHMHIEKHQ